MVGSCRLSTQDSQGDLLAPGENPVYMKRFVGGDYDPGDACQEAVLRLEQLRRDLIGQLLGSSKDEFALQLNPSLDITWSSAEAYVEAATAFIAEQQGILKNAEAGLEGQGLLSESEAASSRPPFEVAIVDVRADKTPLPDLVVTDPSVHVTYQAFEPAN